MVGCPPCLPSKTSMYMCLDELFALGRVILGVAGEVVEYLLGAADERLGCVMGDQSGAPTLDHFQ